MRFVGYAAVFDEPSELWDGFTEVIRKGAFDTTLERGDDVRALWNHDDDNVLGRTSAGTLTLSVDERGLKVDILPPKSAAREIEAIERGDVNQMSFSFTTQKDTLEKHEDGTMLRELLDLTLFDVSPVTWPAYPTTEIHVRSEHGLDDLRARVKALSSDEVNARLAMRRRQVQLMEIA